MNTFKMTMLGGLAAVSLAPLGAQAAYLLDTGIPSGSGLPVVLDSNDYAAAEFSLSAGQTITSIQAYVTAGIDTSGDTFTISLYSDGSLGGRNPTSVYSGQATYTADGWNGLTGLDITGLTAGNYWVALEVNGSSDSALGLALPTGATGGSAAALHYAFSNDGGTTYTVDDSLPIGLQVQAVPLPGALLLFGSGLLGLGGVARRRVANVC
ncbi:MAG TPA: hypothetical protein VHB68_13040 [Steroidobacteraceae bacterium]|nr:hypothetical protein [Steroidobacteraceae bacterium]